MRKPTPEQIQAARKLLAEAGFQVEYLWHIEDVKTMYECDDATAMRVIQNACNCPSVVDRVFSNIDTEAAKLNCKPINK